jgi:hypothetical protein
MMALGFQISEPISTTIEVLEARYISDSNSADEGSENQRNVPGASKEPRESGPPAWLFAEESEVLDQCAREQATALSLTNEGDFSAAQLCLDDAERRYCSGLSSRKSRLSCEAFLLPAHAYLAYRKGSMREAKKHLLRAIKTDETLERAYTVTRRHAHRLHLTTHLVRVEGEMGDESGALRRASRLLRYMEGSTQGGPTVGHWNSNLLSVVPKPVLGKMVTQVVVELAYILAGETSSNARCLLRTLEGCPGTPLSCVWDARTCDWLRLKRTFVTEQSDEFLRKATAYLGGGIPPSPILWKAVVIDIVIALGNIQGPLARELRTRMLQDALGWKGIRAKVATVLNSLSGLPQ